MNFLITQTYNLTNESVTLTSYILDSSREMEYLKIRPAVLICPGGGYRFCSDREAEPIAMSFLSMGYNAFILRYSLNENAAFPKPLEDAEEALDLIIENAEMWNIDAEKIAVCGFSAGGHLAAALSVMGKVRQAATILGYPCISEDICNSDVLAVPVPELYTRVDEKTPPAFIFSTANDNCVPVRSSLDYAGALNSRNISYELHIFRNGGHGLSTADYVTCDKNENRDVSAWIPMCKSWLRAVFFN